MAPKKQPPQGTSSKVKDDKTFGMKNKAKSAKVQKQVAMMQNEASRAGKNKEELAKEKVREAERKAKADAEKAKREEEALLKPVVVQKVPFGVDPKSVLCQYFKLATCDKGSKCKFSHDVNVGRKAEKKNLYEDSREEMLNDTMDKWDEAKLREVVISKAGNPRTTTDIVCKFFIQAIEIEKFGWFWECPNGDQCMYRHALPPGFVLKSQKKALEEAAKANTISLEEFLEVERHKLGSALTPVTPESFAKWKATRLNKKEAEEEAVRKAKDAQAAAGKSSGMSGRDLFQYNPEWFQDDDEGDDEEWDIAQYRREKEEEDEREEQERMEAIAAGFAGLDVDEAGLDVDEAGLNVDEAGPSRASTS